MNVLELVYTTLSQPRVMFPYKRIILLSHMRANTSLFGHLLAENPAIDGYYELHIGYHSWRSLQRQKFLYASTEKLKPGAAYLFDKVLHNDHRVNMALFSGAKVVFMLRPPEKTLPSIVSLYADRDPSHIFATPEGAADYYRGRLDQLSRLLDQASGPLCYVDADCLRTDTARALSTLSEYLELDTPLTQEYSQRAMTGKPRGGDSSTQIGAGQVIGKASDYRHVPTVAAQEVEALDELYRRLRGRFLSSSKLVAAVHNHEALA